MQWIVPPDLEALIKRQVSAGVFTDADEVLRCALESLDAEETWRDQDRLSVATHIEEGWKQADAGELIDADEAAKGMVRRKETWLASRK